MEHMQIIEEERIRNFASVERNLEIAFALPLLNNMAFL